ncbi:hypothetical protein MNBD_GAMMA09-2093 [hydrothermal vent metagenome]|uniref:Uncharacterized protein n=1 Tax=hydrothermal vent metagenome TaxID=652676 RepID=A0A3B0YM40_9ZZZZ
MKKHREFSKNSFWNFTASRGRIELVRERLKVDNKYTLGHAYSDVMSLENGVAGVIIGAGFAVAASSSPMIVAYMGVTAALSAPAAQTGLKALSGTMDAVAPSFWSRTKRRWS